MIQQNTCRCCLSGRHLRLMGFGSMSSRDEFGQERTNPFLTNVFDFCSLVFSLKEQMENSQLLNRLTHSTFKRPPLLLWVSTPTSLNAVSRYSTMSIQRNLWLRIVTESTVWCNGGIPEQHPPFQTVSFVPQPTWTGLEQSSSSPPSVNWNTAST